MSSDPVASTVAPLQSPVSLINIKTVAPSVSASIAVSSVPPASPSLVASQTKGIRLVTLLDIPCELWSSDAQQIQLPLSYVHPMDEDKLEITSVPRDIATDVIFCDALFSKRKHQSSPNSSESTPSVSPAHVRHRVHLF